MINDRKLHLKFIHFKFYNFVSYIEYIMSIDTYIGT